MGRLCATMNPRMTCSPSGMGSNTPLTRRSGWPRACPSRSGRRWTIATFAWAGALTPAALNSGSFRTHGAVSGGWMDTCTSNEELMLAVLSQLRLRLNLRF